MRPGLLALGLCAHVLGSSSPSPPSPALTRHYVITSLPSTNTTAPASLTALRQSRKRAAFFDFWSAVCPSLRFTVCPYQPHPVRGIGITLTFMACFRKAHDDGAAFSFFYEDDARLYADLAKPPGEGGSEFCPGGTVGGEGVGEGVGLSSIPEKIIASWSLDTAVVLLGGHDFSHGCPYSSAKVRVR